MDNNKYNDARKAAEKSKLVDNRLGFGLQTDMTGGTAEAKAIAMRGTSEMSITLPIGSKLTAYTVEPEFARDTLAEVDVTFLQITKSELESLQEMLVRRYSQPGFKHHDSVHEDAISWFNGPVEIELTHTEILEKNLVILYYRDLRRRDAYLEEFGKKFEEEQREEAKKQNAEAQKL